MEVEGIALDSDDVERGRAIHRRVDKPSTLDNSEDENDVDYPKKIRSLTLTSPALKLTATIDITEIEGHCAVPIEYRKGYPHRKKGADEEALQDVIVEPWPTDKVQLGLHAILLEEAGYRVEEAVVYYAKEKRKLHFPVDEALKKEALDVFESAKQCSLGSRPLPLENDPKCPRCSLQPICLPDEINYQRNNGANEELTPRKLWPPHEDGIQVIAQKEGTRIGIRGQELFLSDNDGNKIKTIPLATLESLSIVGNIQVTTQAIRACAEAGVPIAYLSGAGRLVAIIDPVDSVSAHIRKAQVLKLSQPEICLRLAQAVIYAKIINQRTLLMRNNSELPKDVADTLLGEAKKALDSETMEEVRGHEGYAASLYFRYFADTIKGPLREEFKKNGRARRPPPDPVNATLSLAYSMLTHECISALRVARLESTIGGFHTSRPGRPALALDIMEPFRPLIADSIALTCFNREELTEGHFMRTASGCILTEAGRKAFFNALGRRMETDITHPVFEYRLSYRRMIALHARMLAAWFMDEIPTLSFLTTR
jgi:CRISPR-associated protein Cas1